MAKPRRFDWQPTEAKEPATGPRDNFDSRLPLGDIPKPKRKTAADQPRSYQPAKAPQICSDCGGRDFWQAVGGGRYYCSRCNPQQQPETIPARTVVTIPAALADQADELRKGWELIQSKRAAAGLPAMPAITATTEPAADHKKQLDYETITEHNRRYFARCARARDLWQRELITYKEHDKIHGLAMSQLINNPAGDWSAIDSYIDQLENSPAAQVVTFYVDMAIEAARRFSMMGGGWRLHVIAKHLDKDGTGRIKRDDLQAFAYALGVTKPTFYRWMDQARRNDLFSDTQTQAGDWMLILPSAGNAAVAMGCERLTRKVSLPARALIGKGWKARVNGAMMAAYNGKPIARETIQKTRNLAQSTQRYRDAAADIRRVKCIAELGEYESKTGETIIKRLAAAKREGFYKGEFIKDGKFYRRLPNVYQFPLALRGGKGRARKANRIIRQQQNGLLTMQQALSDDATDAVRLYNMTEKQTQATLKKIDTVRPQAPVIYELANKTKPESNGVIRWLAIPTAPQGQGLV